MSGHAQVLFRFMRKMTKLINVMIKVMKMGTGQMRMGLLTITLMMTAGVERMGTR